MNIPFKSIFIGLFCALVLMFDVAEAYAQYGGMHRRTRRRTAIVVSSANRSNQAQAQAEVDAANAETAEANARADAAEAEAANAAAAPPPSSALPIGTVVSVLPPNCSPITVDGYEYYHCTDNYYKTAFQGDQLVYVTTASP